jgi:hypothetical protein
MVKMEEKNIRVGFIDAKSNPTSVTDSGFNIHQNGNSFTGSIGYNINEKDDMKKGSLDLMAEEVGNRDSFLPDDPKGKTQSLGTEEDLNNHLTTFLSFKTDDLESEFSSYFVTLNLPRWRRTISALFVILSGLYIYLITRNTIESVEYGAKYSPILKTTPLNCPIGWYW